MMRLFKSLTALLLAFLIAPSAFGQGNGEECAITICFPNGPVQSVNVIVNEEVEFQGQQLNVSAGQSAGNNVVVVVNTNVNAPPILGLVDVNNGGGGVTVTINGQPISNIMTVPVTNGMMVIGPDGQGHATVVFISNPTSNAISQEEIQEAIEEIANNLNAAINMVQATITAIGIATGSAESLIQAVMSGVQTMIQPFYPEAS